MDIFVLVTRHFSMPRWGSSDLKLPEHVLIKGIVDVQLHPVQSGHAFHKVHGKFAEQFLFLLLIPSRNQLGCNRVGSLSLCGVKRRTDELTAVGQALRKES